MDKSKNLFKLLCRDINAETSEEDSVYSVEL